MKGDKAVRYNLFVVSLIFLGFGCRLISLRIEAPTVLFFFSLLAPSAALLLFVFAYPLVCVRSEGGESFKARFADCYTVKKCGLGNLLLSVIAGFFAYIFYAYAYSGAVCFYEYATGRVIVYTASFSFHWLRAAVWLLQGVLVPALTELVFRGAGSAVYGESRLKFIAPVLFGLFMSFSADGRIKWLAAGIFALAAVRRSGSVLPAVVLSVLFSLLEQTVGNIFVLPFSFKAVSSAETALYYAFISAAAGIFALGAATLCIMLMDRGTEGIRKRRKLSADGRITAAAVVAVGLVLSIVLALI